MANSEVQPLLNYSTTATNQTYDNPSSQTSTQILYNFIPSSFTPFLPLHLHPSSTSPVLGVLRQQCILTGNVQSKCGMFIHVSIGGRAGWICRFAFPDHSHSYSLDIDPQLVTVTRLSSYVKHQAWLGNHTFFLNGRLMFGSDFAFLTLTVFLLLSVLTLFFLFVVPSLPSSPFPLKTTIIACTSLLAPIVFALLLITALTDPGIVPSVSSPHKPPPPSLPFTVGKGPYAHRYCQTCNIFRPPRAKHCTACNVCVER